MFVIEVKNLSKKYKNFHAVNNLSFNIEKNSVVGLIGPNGAGKTTTMKMLMGLIKKSEGSIKILGKKIEYGVIPDDVIYLQDVPGFYDFLTAEEYLSFILNINKNKLNEEKIKETLKLVGLYDDKDKRIGKFSRGMRQRMGIAASIVSYPKILILDEPVSALDPIGRKEIFDQISKLKEKMTIIFSTHILDDVERVCDKVILINNGVKIKEGTIKAIKKEYITNVIEVIFSSKKDLNEFKKKIEINDGIDFFINELKVIINDNDINSVSKRLFSFILENNIAIESFIVKSPSLEEIFIKEVVKR